MPHTISARLAGAPMDEILLSSGMPRALYRNNKVLPQTHIHRSLGGPIFSLIGSWLSLLWWQRAGLPILRGRKGQRSETGTGIGDGVERAKGAGRAAEGEIQRSGTKRANSISWSFSRKSFGLRAFKPLNDVNNL
jgi:hypothetical protein